MKILVPKSIHDYSQPKITTNFMCKTCAYRTPLTPKEIEFEKTARIDRGGAHYCHERANHVCFGSMQLQKKLDKSF